MITWLGVSASLICSLYSTNGRNRSQAFQLLREAFRVFKISHTSVPVDVAFPVDTISYS